MKERFRGERAEITRRYKRLEIKRREYGRGGLSSLSLNNHQGGLMSLKAKGVQQKLKVSGVISRRDEKDKVRLIALLSPPALTFSMTPAFSPPSHMK